jgi:ADP-ribosylglycohydrolase
MAQAGEAEPAIELEPSRAGGQRGVLPGQVDSQALSEKGEVVAKDLFDAVYGCLIGGAIGDALGAPVEGLNHWEIRERNGRLEELIASPGDNTNGQPGGVTGDTILRQYVALAIARKGGRITPHDLAALWVEKGNFRLLGGNERAIYEKLSWGANPCDAGRGGSPSGAAAVAIPPIGIINAGDPAQAYQDGYVISSVAQDGEERAAAATLAAGVAAALGPGATLDGVVEAMDRHSSDLMRRAIELALDLARSAGSVAAFTEQFYAHLTDWRMPWPEDKMRPVAGHRPLRSKFYSRSSLELIPVSLALLRLCPGDVNEALVEGANFGRACHSIAGIIGCIAGALSGAAAIRGAWVNTVEEANKDLFAFLEGDPTANFYAMAWWLVKALKAERQAAGARLRALEGLLGW